MSLKLLRYCVFAFFIFLILPKNTIGQVNQQEDRIKGWQGDIDSLLSLMRTQHYVYRSKPLPEQLLKNAADLKTKVARFSDERMLLELERLAFYMHDGHSYILPVARRVQTVYMPIQFYLFSDGTYIIDADEPYKNLIGCKVLNIHDVNIDKLENDMNSYIHQDNEYTVKWFAPSILRFRGIYELYGLAPGSADISMNLVDQNKNKITRKISFIPANNFHGIPKLFSSRLANNLSIPLYLSNVEDNFWFTHLSDKKQIYFQFNQVEDKENETLGAFGKRLDSVLHVEKPKLLIIDVRHNNGGNLDLLKPLIDGIKHFENENPKSKIIVITGRNTFSAAQVFISLVNKDTHALFAGEPSSSSPNFVGEGNYITLPWSGAMGSISNRYHESIPGDKRKWIEPDFPVSLSSQEYFKNQDPVMEFILKKMN
jgi:hypothetical protein